MPRVRPAIPLTLALLFGLTLAGTLYVRSIILDKHLAKAVELDDPDMVRSVALCFPSPARAPVEGWGSALNWAMAKGHWDLAHNLLDRGADPNVVMDSPGRDPCRPSRLNIWRLPPILAAVERGRADLVRHMLKKGADPEGCDFQRTPPLVTAGALGDVESLTLLLDHGAKVNRDGGTGTALHRAAFYDRVEAIRLLVSRGAEVNVRDGVGNTPLHLAAHGGNAGAVDALLALGADVNLKNQSDRTALDFARQERLYPGIVATLESRGAK